jgi:hypothetical protein
MKSEIRNPKSEDPVGFRISDLGFRISSCILHSALLRGLLVVALLLALAGPAVAGAVSPAGPAPASAHRFAPPARAPLPLATWFSKIIMFLRSALGNQARMLQVATIGMCIGLYIMMRK